MPRESTEREAAAASRAVSGRPSSSRRGFRRRSRSSDDLAGALPVATERESTRTPRRRSAGRPRGRAAHRRRVVRVRQERSGSIAAQAERAPDDRRERATSRPLPCATTSRRPAQAHAGHDHRSRASRSPSLRRSGRPASAPGRVARPCAPLAAERGGDQSDTASAANATMSSGRSMVSAEVRLRQARSPRLSGRAPPVAQPGRAAPDLGDHDGEDHAKTTARFDAEVTDPSGISATPSADRPRWRATAIRERSRPWHIGRRGRTITARRGGAVEGEVEPEHVDPRLAQDAELAALDVRLDQPPDPRRVHPARLRHPPHLVEGRRRADVGIETAAGRRHQVDRDGRGLPGSASRSASIRPLTAAWRAGFSGPRLDPMDAPAL